MKKHWMIVLAFLVIATGCGPPQETAERAAQDELQDAKVRKALANQKRGSMGMPEELGKEDSATPKDVEDDPQEKTDPSATLDAQQVLNDAIANAKSEDQALFVHFTADW